MRYQVLVQNNNIYYYTAAHDAPIQTLTTSGKDGEIYNGIPDWVYEGKWGSS